MNTARRSLDKGATLMLLALAPAIAIIVAFRLYPLLRAVTAAAGGGFRAPWGAVLRTWGLEALSGLAQLLLGAVGGLCVATLAIPRKRLRTAVVAVALLPFFIPQTVLAALLMWLLGVRSGQGGLASVLIAVVAGALGWAGIAAASGVAWLDRAPEEAGGSGLLRGVGLVLLARATLLLAQNTDSVVTLSAEIMRPVVPASYALVWPQAGMSPASVGGAATAWLAQFVLQLIGTLLLLRAGAALVARGSGGRGEAGQARISMGRGARGAAEAVGALWLLVVATLVACLVAVPVLDLRNAASLLARHLRGVSIGFAFLQFGLVNLVSSAVAVFFAVCAAYLLSRLGRAGRRALCALLAILLAMVPAGIQDYLVFREFSMLNTFYPFLIGGLTPAFLVLVLAAIKSDAPAGVAHEVDRAEPFRFFHGYVRPLLPVALGLGLCCFCVAWNTVGAVGTFMVSSPTGYPPAALFRALVPTFGVDSGVLLLGLLVSIVPIGLFLALRRFIHPQSVLGGARW